MRYLVIAALSVLSLAALAQSSAPYSITKTYSLGGDGFWDYVVPDPPNHRLFIARQTRVMVVDEASGKLEFPYFVDEVDPQPDPIPPGKSLTGYVLRKGQPLLCT